jgi:proton-dependent oligopeptide transporter, POT family
MFHVKNFWNDSKLESDAHNVEFDRYLDCRIEACSNAIVFAAAIAFNCPPSHRVGNTMSSSRADCSRAVKGDVLGHPRGLTFLFATEMWERFSYYGMRALLVLYMVKYLLLPGHADVIGLNAARGALESIFGPLGVQPFASQIYGLYTGFVYLTPLFGGWLADYMLGQRRTVILGAALMACGHFMMAIEPLFLPALFTLILGNGAFKPNISTQVGGLYAPDDHRRDRAYSIFYVGINIGAFLAPLVCGTLGEELGWHYGFAAAGAGMTIALAVYLYAAPMLPPDEMHKAMAAGRAEKPLDRNEWRAVLALIALFLPTTFFWATYEQQGNTIALWADEHTDRTIDLIVWQGAIPVTWFQAFNPFMIFAFTPFIIKFWAWQEQRGAEPSTVAKMALGCFGVSLSYLIMAGAAWTADSNLASWWWLFGYFVVITIGELYVSPIGLSLVSKIAPARMISTMMGLWLGTSFAGNFVAGWLGSFWSFMDKMSFFIMIAAVAAGAGVVIWSFNRPLKGILQGSSSDSRVLGRPDPLRAK